MEPQSRMLELHGGETAAEAIAQIEEQGGIAWVRPEYGSDMGHENVYWGERLFFFTLEAIQQRKAGANTPAFEYLYVRKNDGSPSPYSAEQSALNEAFVAFHETGGYEWSKVEIMKLPCPVKDDGLREHYPDLCWHYRVAISSV